MSILPSLFLSHGCVRLIATPWTGAGDSTHPAKEKTRKDRNTKASKIVLGKGRKHKQNINGTHSRFWSRRIWNRPKSQHLDDWEIVFELLTLKAASNLVDGRSKANNDDLKFTWKARLQIKTTVMPESTLTIQETCRAGDRKGADDRCSIDGGYLVRYLLSFLTISRCGPLFSRNTRMRTLTCLFTVHREPLTRFLLRRDYQGGARRLQWRRSVK